MNEGQGAGDERIGQLKVKFLNLRCQHQPLVDDGATGAGGDVEGLLVLDVGGGNLVFRAAADAVKQALEGLLVEALRTAEEELLDIGLGAAGFAADGVAIDGRIAPAEDSEALLLGNALEDAFALQTVVLFHGQEAHGHAVGAGFGQGYAQFSAFARKEGVGNLNEDAGAVAGLRVAARGAAMGEVDEHLEALADDLVALFAPDVRDKSNAAGIVLIPRMIEALRLGCAETAI